MRIIKRPRCDVSRSFSYQVDATLWTKPPGRWHGGEKNWTTISENALEKGDSCTLGYKGNLATDEEGYGEKVVVRPSNESEQINFNKIADPNYLEGRRVYADKGSNSRSNRAIVKVNNMKSGITHKASRNNPFKHSQKTFS